MFDCIPGAHENRARVSRPFLPRAGDAIHPALREWEGSGCETIVLVARVALLTLVVLVIMVVKGSGGRCSSPSSYAVALVTVVVVVIMVSS